MKLSTRSRYGLRFMVYLGYKYNQGAIQLNEAALNEHISKKYLEQIVPYLKAKNLITSQRGTAGGYLLARSPETITLLNIINALEGSLTLVECKTDNQDCQLNSNCVTKEIWQNLGSIIEKYLEEKKLSELVSQYRKNISTNEPSSMYYI